MHRYILLPSFALIAAGNLAAQGSLTPPPGPPAPVMRTLNQIQPRTPLVAGAPGVSIDPATGTISITESGSYCLTRDVIITTVGANGIDIGAQNVDLDMGGFEILHNVPATVGMIVSAIRIDGVANQTVAVRNGRIRATGGGAPSIHAAVCEHYINLSIVFENIQVAGCGKGLMLGEYGQSVVRNCTIVGDCAPAIYASVVEGCAIKTGGNGYSTVYCGVISNSQVNRTGSGHAIDCTGSVSNCMGVADGGIGIMARTATNCTARTSTGSHAMKIFGTASFCDAKHTYNGVAIESAIAVACTANSGTIVSPQKHLGTP